MAKSIHKLNIASISYDDQLDILELHTNGSVHHSQPLNDTTILHFSSKNQLVGLELTGLAHINNIPQVYLKHITAAHITLYPTTENTICIGATLTSKINNQEIPTVFSLPPITTK